MAFRNSKMVISQHAQLRIQQRGVNDEALQLVLFAGDRRVHLGDQCVAWCLSRQRAQGLRDNGIPNSVISRAERITLIVSEDNTLVTVLKGSLAEGRRDGGDKPRRGGKRVLGARWH